MVKEQITILNKTGLHTRPGKRVVSEAKQFECDIKLVFGEKEANVKSLIKLLKLGISQNHVVELICDGADEEAALDHMKKYILSLEE
ncbi:MAG: HPr family phosphocarrier protein [Spirochaetia bacterium]|jgi:phosphotransferase system HPr (HPr) family protein|nr:HPr family phosphocarrier protein [Spirochaetia bacterium]